MFLCDDVAGLCKQFVFISGPTFRRSWSGSKPLDTLIVFLKDFFFNEKSPDDNRKHGKNTQHAKSYFKRYDLQNTTCTICIFVTMVTAKLPDREQLSIT